MPNIKSRNVHTALLYKLLLPLVLLLFCETDTLHAQDTYVYGIGPGGSRFGRMDFLNGSMETLGDGVPAINLELTYGAAIDPHRKRYTYISGHQTIVSLDLNTGQVVKQKSYPLGKMYMLDYDEVTDRYYIIYAGKSEHMLAIDSESLEPVDLGFTFRVASWHTCGFFVDGERGLLIYRPLSSQMDVLDLSKGTLLREVDTGSRVSGASYNDLDGLIYAYRMNWPELALITIDPQTGVVNTLFSVLTTWNLHVQLLCLNRVHTATQTHLSVTDGQLLAVDLATQKLTVWPNTEQQLRYGVCVYNNSTHVTEVSGRVYFDQNNNCEPEDSDASLAGMRINFGDKGYRAYSDGAGNFRVFLPEGEYDVSLENEWPWQVDCAPAPAKVVIDQEGTPLDGITLSASPLVSFDHLEISLLAERSIVGRPLVYTIKAVNKGTRIFSGILNFSYADILQNFKSTPAADLHEPGLAQWNIRDLGIGAAQHIQVELRIPGDPELRGTEICARAYLEKQDEILAADRTDEECVIIRAAYDPNDISVAPRGFGPRGSILAEDSTLAYTIRFQNIGDAPAFDVVILDTLDEDLDVNSIHFGAATHDYDVSLIAGKILEFRFNNIMLPGKDEDEPGSHGAVKYKLDLRNGLPENTEIHNRAAIYFDFNEPIITNTVVNTIASTITGVQTGELDDDELELRLLGSSLFVLHGSTSLNGRLSVYSVLGRKVFERQVQNQPQATIDLGSLPSGQYLIRYSNGTASFVRSVNVAR